MTVTAECTQESDGYHLHEIHLNDGTTIEEHLHSWKDEHQKMWPNSRPVEIRRGRHERIGGYHTVAEAWNALGTEEPIPACPCG